MFNKGDQVIYLGIKFLKDRQGSLAEVMEINKKGKIRIRFLDGYETRVEADLLKKEGRS